MTGYCDGCGNTQCICAEIESPSHHLDAVTAEQLTIATLTAEWDALTQRVAELEAESAGQKDKIRGLRSAMNQSSASWRTERDAAIAEAGRLREALDRIVQGNWVRNCDGCGIAQLGEHYLDTKHKDGCRYENARAALATAPPVASERRAAEVRVIQTSIRWLECENDRELWGDEAEIAEREWWDAVKALAALDAAPGEVAE